MINKEKPRENYEYYSGNNAKPFLHSSAAIGRML